MGNCKECTISARLVKSERIPGLCRPCYHKEDCRLWRLNNKEKSLEYIRKWTALHPEGDYARYRRYYEKNKPKIYAYNKAKSKRVRQATPKWLTAEQRKQIRDIYTNCPPGYHVDHIIPLQAKSMSGLHVPWNLQYLLAEENLRKGNKVG